MRRPAGGCLDVGQDAERLATYERLCGFGVRDLVPATWIHVQAFPLQMGLLSAPDSPFSLAGIVHVTNSMTLLRPVSVGERLRLTSSYGPPREHRRGVLFDMVGEAYVGDALVWRGVRAYLARDAKLPGMLREDQSDGVTWHTFAGGAVNRLLAAGLEANIPLPLDLPPVTASKASATASGPDSSRTRPATAFTPPRTWPAAKAARLPLATKSWPNRSSFCPAPPRRSGQSCS